MGAEVHKQMSRSGGQSEDNNRLQTRETSIVMSQLEVLIPQKIHDLGTVEKFREQLTAQVLSSAFERNSNYAVFGLTSQSVPQRNHREKWMALPPRG
ncbi:hypothetical protein TNCV_1794461 [Trichonephila clavipes]|nr:hypothetical protein TNCV_1794461 [Trichonephila clavipes]